MICISKNYQQKNQIEGFTPWGVPLCIQDYINKIEAGKEKRPPTVSEADLNAAGIPPYKGE